MHAGLAPSSGSSPKATDWSGNALLGFYTGKIGRFGTAFVSKTIHRDRLIPLDAHKELDKVVRIRRGDQLGIYLTGSYTLDFVS